VLRARVPFQEWLRALVGRCIRRVRSPPELVVDLVVRASLRGRALAQVGQDSATVLELLRAAVCCRPRKPQLPTVPLALANVVVALRDTRRTRKSR
jgi:hypothetical protein